MPRRCSTFVVLEAHLSPCAEHFLQKVPPLIPFRTLHTPAARDFQGNTGDEARVIRGEKRYGRGYFRRIRRAAPGGSKRFGPDRTARARPGSRPSADRTGCRPGPAGGGRGRPIPMWISTAAIVGIGNTVTHANNIAPRSIFFIFLERENLEPESGLEPPTY